MKRIYAPDAYYERVRRFLERYHPISRTRRSLSEYLALRRSVVKQGILGDARELLEVSLMPPPGTIMPSALR